MEPSAALVRALVGEQFPQWAHLPVRPVEAQGHDNRTFRLGDDLAVRLPSAAGYVAAVAKEDHVLPRLAPHLPIAVPVVVSTGSPAAGYPFPWSVRRWLDGHAPAAEPGLDRSRLARDLAGFLVALRGVDATGGPACGRHSFHRGCHPSAYADEVQRALDDLGARVDRRACERVWRAANLSAWQGDPVWFHGDVAEGNLLVRDGALAAVIDFGTCGAGDPACDLVIAWTFFDEAERAAFRAAVGLDDATWARGAGWALWKALITLAERDDPVQARALEAVLTG